MIITNDRNERIEQVGDIILNLNYWDCECEDNYIHRIDDLECPKCGALQNESPNSRANEVDLMYKC